MILSDILNILNSLNLCFAGFTLLAQCSNYIVLLALLTWYPWYRINEGCIRALSNTLPLGPGWKFLERHDLAQDVPAPSKAIFFWVYHLTISSWLTPSYQKHQNLLHSLLHAQLVSERFSGWFLNKSFSAERFSGVWVALFLSQDSGKEPSKEAARKVKSIRKALGIEHTGTYSPQLGVVARCILSKREIEKLDIEYQKLVESWQMGAWVGEARVVTQVSHWFFLCNGLYR